eukprot:scaffold189810_cov28-Tisochrysis_lutea.AAC.2
MPTHKLAHQVCMHNHDHKKQQLNEHTAALLWSWVPAALCPTCMLRVCAPAGVSLPAMASSSSVLTRGGHAKETVRENAGRSFDRHSPSSAPARPSTPNRYAHARELARGVQHAVCGPCSSTTLPPASMSWSRRVACRLGQHARRFAPVEGHSHSDGPAKW